MIVPRQAGPFQLPAPTKPDPITYRYPEFKPPKLVQAGPPPAPQRPGQPQGPAPKVVVTAGPLPPQPILPSPAEDPRKALARALVERREAMDALAAAGDAFARGEQLLAQTETDLDRAKGDSDATIADWATETAQNLARGQEMPPSPALDTNNVVEAEAKHRAATLAGQRLLLQQRASQASLATAEMRIQGAVIAVMQGDAALIAAELAECESKAAKLRTRLTALPRLWLDNRAVKVSPEIVQLVRDRPPNADLSQPAILKSVSAWRSYAEELKLDPNAVSSLG